MTAPREESDVLGWGGVGWGGVGWGGVGWGGVGGGWRGGHCQAPMMYEQDELQVLLLLSVIS
jgi:hypothetical protein